MFGAGGVDPLLRGDADAAVPVLPADFVEGGPQRQAFAAAAERDFGLGAFDERAHPAQEVLHPGAAGAAGGGIVTMAQGIAVALRGAALWLLVRGGGAAID